MGGKSLRFPPFMFRITIPRVKTVPVPARNVCVATSGRKIGLKSARNVFVATSGRKIGLNPAQNHRVVILFMPQYKFLLQVLN